MSRWTRILTSGLIAASLLAVTVPAQAQTLLERLFDGKPGVRLLERTPQQVQPRLQPRVQPRLRARTTAQPQTRRGPDPIYNRQIVRYETAEKAGTIIVDTRNHFLYLVQSNGEALRYGIGVARDGFEWSGTHRVTRKAEWPGWTPPSEMRKRQPELPAYMPGGPGNPLGARALYLGSTLYRIHGTAEPWTIGHNVSSGCIRLVNEDVIDLYGRVGVGAKVVVL